MSEQDNEAFEARSRALFQDSVEGLDMRIRSRLTQARSAALEAAQQRRFWWSGWKVWTPAAGVTAAAILGVVLWLGSPVGHQSGTLADAQTSFEDLDLVASSDEGSTDAIDMLQDDIDFYSFADKATNSGPAA
jgi:ATP/maltotriose-dependent transcriptional regulator MalT